MFITKQQLKEKMHIPIVVLRVFGVDSILLSKSQCGVVEKATGLGIRKLGSKCFLCHSLIHRIEISYSTSVNVNFSLVR